MTGALDAILRKARAGTLPPEELFAALSSAQLLLAGAPGEDGVLLPHVLSVEGSNYAAIFTSGAAAKELPDAPGFAEMTGADLGANWPDGLGAILNPGTDAISLVLDTDAVRMMAHPERAKDRSVGRATSGRVPQREELQAGESVAIGAPAVAPSAEFVDAVRASVRDAADVEVAYIFQLVDGTQTPRLIVGTVLVSGANHNDAMSRLASAVAAAHPPSADIEFMVLSDDLRATVSEFVDALR